ncbi:MAG: hypothetical protein EKK46_11825 [Rhodocyclaceae bacterium]|nr:MAG: hypothetical protein EKK46_11825 [Rhodocyclaceae bacterium]
MIQLQTQHQASHPGKEPTVVKHDCHLSFLFSDDGLDTLFNSVADESIKAKTAYQQYSEIFNTERISRQALMELVKAKDKDCWIALHEIESNALLKPLFMSMAATLISSLPRMYGDVRFCTGSLFISRGKASTPYHLDYGSNLLLQLRGNKRFLAFSPNDPELVSKQSLREFFGGHPNPPSLKYDDSFDQKALALDLEPGQGIYMPSTTPHCTETRTRDLSVTVSLSFVSPLAERLRRSSLFDARFPSLHFIPSHLKCGVLAVYEGIKAARGDIPPRHKSFRPLLL